MDIPERILIVGLGQTGVSVARFLGKKGKAITITDMKPEKELAQTISELKDIRFTGHFGSHLRDDFLNNDMIVLSPGVDSELPYIKEALNKGIKVVGEMELASAFVDRPIIAITGTNGKTTVTTLIGEIFRKAFGDVFVGGNIGNPLMNYVLNGGKAHFIIVEISSFQLETIHRFHPETSVMLNITEDHLDRYRGFAEYKRAKLRIFENQTRDDFAVLNKNLSLRKKLEAKKLYFSTSETLKEGAFYKNNMMHVRLNNREFVYKRGISPLVGIHNTENLLAALIVSHIYGVEHDLIEEILSKFKGLPHRVEHVRVIKGVRFFNDSKATNVDATKRALESMDGEIILIAGGKDKGGSYRVIVDDLKKVKALVLIGEAKDRIKEELSGYVKTYSEDDLNRAVKKAFAIAKRGDIVLFSPMCSSFDMFRDYKERGNIYKKIVESL